MNNVRSCIYVGRYEMKVAIPPISTKRTIIPHLSTTEHQKKTTQKFDTGTGTKIYI